MTIVAEQILVLSARKVFCGENEWMQRVLVARANAHAALLSILKVMSIALVSSPFIDGRPPTWASGYGQDRYGYFAEFSISTGPHDWQFITQRLRWIPAGSFMMGSPADEEDRGNDEVPHEITLTHGFWLADTACTQAVWKAVTGENPSKFKNEEDSRVELPVENASFDDVQAYLSQLNVHVGKQATFSLPTEAQWEYACRAGTNTPFSFGKTISTDQANFDGNNSYAGAYMGEYGKYRQSTVSVKSLRCNAWGLYQMHGNVWEWCSDWYAEYSRDDDTDPVGPDSGSNRVLRGGSWINSARDVRSACRLGIDPGIHEGVLGFRLLSSAS